MENQWLLPDTQDDVLDSEKLNILVEHRRKTLPRLFNKSISDIADCSGVSESTIKAMIGGKNRNPRIATLLRLLKCIGGGSIDDLVGNAHDSGVSDHSLIDTLKTRLEAKDERIKDLETYQKELREKYVAAREKIAACEEITKAYGDSLIRQRRFSRWLKALAIITMVLFVLLVLIFFDLSHPDVGKIGEVEWR